MAKLPDLKLSDLLAAGAHFGHRTYRWNPKMAPYIYGARNGVHVIDLKQTLPMFYQALTAIQSVVAGGGRILFVGTKSQAQLAVKDAAERSGMYYVNHRWLGGMITNWKTISNSIKRLKQIEEQFEKDEKATAHYEEQLKNYVEGDVQPKNLSPIAHLNKKERLMLSREKDKLDLVLGGIKNMGGLPDLIVVLDVKKDAIAVNEARCLGVPVVGIVDTNATVENITYPIPANDDSTRATTLYCQLFSDAILSGIATQAAKMQSRPAAASSAKVAPAKKVATPTKVTLSPKAKAAAEVAETEAQAEETAAPVAAKETAKAKPKAEAKA